MLAFVYYALHGDEDSEKTEFEMARWQAVIAIALAPYQPGPELGTIGPVDRRSAAVTPGRGEG